MSDSDNGSDVTERVEIRTFNIRIWMRIYCAINFVTKYFLNELRIRE